MPTFPQGIGRRIASGGSPPDVQFTLCKVDAETNMAIGKSSVDGSTAVYGIYSDNACKNKVAEITICEDGMGSVKLKSGTYYAKEISAPTGYALDPDDKYAVFAPRCPVCDFPENGRETVP